MTPRSFSFQGTVLAVLLGSSALFLSGCGDKAPATGTAAKAEADPMSVMIKPDMAAQFKVSPLEKETIQADLATRERLRQELLADKRRKQFEEVISDIRTKATVRLADASRYITEDTGKP